MVEAAPVPAAKRSTRVRLVLGAGLAVVVLAVVGALGGWLLAGGSRGGNEPSGSGGSTAPATPAPVTTPMVTGGPGEAPTGTVPTGTVPTGNRPSPGQLVLPDLVGQDFEQARQELRELGLGWTLVFDEAGAGRSVTATRPGSGTPVRRGTSVAVSVSGPAPTTAVPALVGLTCQQAAARVVDAGLYPRYPTGRTGTVVAQDPAPPVALRWNDRLSLSCGGPPVTPTGPVP